MKIRHLWVLFTFFAILFISLACTRQPGWETLQKQIREQQKTVRELMDLRESNKSLRNEVEKLINIYQQSHQYYPDKEDVPGYLYQAAKLYSYPLQDYDNTISTLQKIRKQYPENPVAERALFLIGYTYSEHLSRHDKAKEVYATFIQDYPESDLLPSVRFEMKHMGQSITDLDFLKKGKNP